MNQTKLIELKQRAKSAFGLTQVQLNKKSNKYLFPGDESNKINSIKNKDKIRKLKANLNKQKTNNSNKLKDKPTSDYDFSSRYENLSFLQRSDRISDNNGYKMDEYNPFILSANYKNIININNRLIGDLNEQIKFLNKQKKVKKFNYKQTVNLQKLNDYIIYEYTKNKMEYNKMNNKKTTTSFRMPLQYRRMGNHSKKEDLIPINNLPKINLEEILILHNSNTRNSMSKHKVQNYYLKNNIKYRKYKLNQNNNKEYSGEIALKYIMVSITYFKLI